jgi:hypothetical protein
MTWGIKEKYGIGVDISAVMVQSNVEGQTDPHT